MTGLMMDYPLTLTHILERSAKIYPRREIASRVPDGSMHRYTYGDFHKRVHRLAHGLQSLGAQAGDRIGTLCWIVCFWWMHRISSRQNSTLEELHEMTARIEKLSRAEHELITDVHPQVSEIKEQVKTVREVVSSERT